MKLTLNWRMPGVAAIGVLALLTTNAAAEEGQDAAPAAAEQTTQPAEAGAEAPKPQIDIRKLFATNCSWCHDGYGMHAGKGPKLAGTSMTEQQVYKRIAKGKSGAMPGFEKTLSKEQIQALAEYIKGLKDPDS
jgi:mono/diheme cytochrome c family protein